MGRKPRKRAFWYARENGRTVVKTKFPSLQQQINEVLEELEMNTRQEQRLNGARPQRPKRRPRKAARVLKIEEETKRWEPYMKETIAGRKALHLEEWRREHPDWMTKSCNRR